jgi:acetyl esterase/lipase
VLVAALIGLPQSGASAATPTIVLDTATDLVDAQRVTLTGSGYRPGEWVAAMQCPTAATTADACGNFTGLNDLIGTNGTFTLGVVLDAIVRSPEGTFDCRAADACVLVAGTDVFGAFAFATRFPLEFDPDAPLAPPPQLTIEPSTDLVDGQLITVRGTGFVRERFAQIFECTGAPESVDDCDEWSRQFVDVDDSGTFETQYRLLAVIERLGNGTVDCRPTACVLGAATTFDDLATVTLPFDPDAPLAPPPTVVVTPDDDLVDGQVVTVEGSGFQPNAYVRAAQCGPDPTSEADCVANTIQYVPTDAHGAFTASLTVLAAISTQTGAVDCRTSTAPCLVVATAGSLTSSRAGRAALRFDPDEPLLPRPTITVTPAADIQDGATVRVHGTGFAPNSGIQLGLCRSGLPRACDGSSSIFPTSDATGALDLDVLLYADFETFDGNSVNCRQPPGCELVATEFSRGFETSAPVTFAPPGPSQGRYLDPVFDEVDVTTDVVYRETVDHHGNPVQLHLDIYRPTGDTETRRPLVIWMHGGYFVFGDKSNMAPYAQAFARRGYVAVSLQYRLRYDQSISDPDTITDGAADAYEDATAAVAWLREHAAEYGIDPGAIAAGGYSAGAITAANLAYMPGQSGPPTSSIDAAVPIAGFTFGRPEAGEPPSLMFQGSADTVVPFPVAKNTCNRAVAAGILCELVRYEGAGHEIVSSFERDIISRTADFLAQHVLDPAGFFDAHADAGGPYTAVEGSTIGLDASASSDARRGALAYSWQPAERLADADTATPRYRARDDGTERIALTVTNDYGNQDHDVAVVTSTNAPPVIHGVDVGPSIVGRSLSLAALIGDPGRRDTHTAHVDWGDGTSSAGTISRTRLGPAAHASHTYAEPGRYRVVLTVTDDDGGAVTWSRLITRGCRPEHPWDTC